MTEHTHNIESIVKDVLINNNDMLMKIAQDYFNSDTLFEAYIKSHITGMTALEFLAVSQILGSDIYRGLVMPETYQYELNKRIVTNSVLLQDCRTRTTTSDRIVQPSLISEKKVIDDNAPESIETLQEETLEEAKARRIAKRRDKTLTLQNREPTHDIQPAHVAWPGESVGESEYTVVDTLSTVEIPIMTHQAHVDMNQIDAKSDEPVISQFLDLLANQIIDILENIVVNDRAYGILKHERYTDYQSESMQTVAGYIPSEVTLTADAIKVMLFHLPRGYRQRARWYMNENTAKQLLHTVDDDNNCIVDTREINPLLGYPRRMLGRPIVIVKSMPDVKLGSAPIIFGDLSRGYLLGRRVDGNKAMRDLHTTRYTFQHGSQVLQPAAMKVLRIVQSETQKEIE